MENIIYKNIEAERVRHGDTKENLAQKLDVTTKTYFNWMRGKTEIPASTLIQMKRIRNLLSVCDFRRDTDGVSWHIAV